MGRHQRWDNSPFHTTSDCADGAKVYPAAGFASAIRERGGKVAVFNIENTKGDNRAHFLFLGPCETVLPQVLYGDSPLETDGSDVKSVALNTQ